MDGIERRLGDTAQVLRLDVTDGVGRELALRYGVRRLPTRVLLDSNGDVVLKQTGPPNRQAILDAIDQIAD